MLWTTKVSRIEPGHQGAQQYAVYSPCQQGVVMAASPADAGRVCEELNNLILRAEMLAASFGDEYTPPPDTVTVRERLIDATIRYHKGPAVWCYVDGRAVKIAEREDK